MNKVKQKDIAERLNLSATTVAKILNHDPFYRVSEQTRKETLRVACEMGYTGSRRRYRNIAFLVCGAVSVGTTELLRAVSSEADRLQQRILFISKPEQCSFQELINSVNPLSVDGVIVIGEYLPRAIEKLASLMPVVVYDNIPRVKNVDRVFADVVKLSEIELPPKKWTQRRVGINMLDTDSQTEVSYGREEAPAEAV